MRKHTEVMKPPRALFVPFELGRPFGPPNNPKLQQEVLFDALKLLERHDGPIIEDYIPPFTAPNVTEEETEGWICPVNLAIPDSNLSNTQKLALNLKQEVNLLQPWYNLSSESSGGRKLDGLTTYSPEEIIDLLVNFIENPDIVSFVSDQPIGRALKITSDDLKHFYFQSAMARPKNISDGQLVDWFYGETLAGKLLIKIRAICLVHENKSLQLVGRTNFVPNAMLKYV